MYNGDTIEYQYVNINMIRVLNKYFQTFTKVIISLLVSLPFQQYQIHY